MRALDFPMFARAVSPSHGYAHMVAYGTPADILGLRIAAGDILMGDCHGVIQIPVEVAADVVRVAAELRKHDRLIIDLCASPGFTTEKLRKAIESTR